METVLRSLMPDGGSITASGLDTSPSAILGPQPVTAKAAGGGDPTKPANSTAILIPPVSVSLSPAASTLGPSEIQQFSSTITGTVNTGATWSLNPWIGSISQSGLYTAPSRVPGSHSIMITARSVIDPTRYATGVVSVVPAPTSGQCDSGEVFTGPLVITAGGTYSGNWESTDPNVPALSIKTTAPVIILNSKLRGPGDLLTAMWNNQVVIRHNCFVGVNPNRFQVAKGSPVRIQNATNLVVEHNDFEGTGYNGVSVTEYWGNRTEANTIKIRYNRFHNVDGRYSDGNGGYLTNLEGRYSHAVILSLVRHVAGVEIAWNQVINEAGRSQVTDSINVYSSSGTPQSPILIHDNYIQGQYSANPTSPDALGYSGTGITTDDLPRITNPADATSFVRIYNNQIVSIALAGIAIAVGHDNAMYSNRVVSNGQLADGSNITRSIAAGFVTNNYLNEPAGVYGNNAAYNNFSAVRRYRAQRWERSDYYFGFPLAINWNNLQRLPVSADLPTLADEAAELSNWLAKLRSAGLSVGR